MGDVTVTTFTFFYTVYGSDWRTCWRVSGIRIMWPVHLSWWLMMVVAKLLMFDYSTEFCKSSTSIADAMVYLAIDVCP